MPCNCSGSHIFGRLQKLSGLQKLQTISKSGLSAYNDHVQNTADNGSTFDSSLSLCRTFAPVEAWSAPSLHIGSNGPLPTLTTSAVGYRQFNQLHHSSSLNAERFHSTAATKASPAYLKTTQLFQDDRKFALEQAHSSSPRIAASHSSFPDAELTPDPKDAPMTQQRNSQSPAASMSSGHSDTSANSMADSVSSYHGYAGVNYQTGVKDIDAVRNFCGYSLNDYKAVFGEGYVHGCVPWEDQHISKHDQKKFQKLHSRRVQLLQELHSIEQGIRELMD